MDHQDPRDQREEVELEEHQVEMESQGPLDHQDPQAPEDPREMMDLLAHLDHPDLQDPLDNQAMLQYGLDCLTMDKTKDQILSIWVMNQAKHH